MVTAWRVTGETCAPSQYRWSSQNPPWHPGGRTGLRRMPLRRAPQFWGFGICNIRASRQTGDPPWGDPMRTGGQTTVIKRVLERRAHRPSATQEDTTATIAVMLRVLPPPRALVAIADAGIRADFERRIPPDMLDVEAGGDEGAALVSLITEFRPVVVTDSLELIRKIRAQQPARAPYIVYVTPLDEPRAR